MSRFTYWISAILALVGTVIAIYGITYEAYGQHTGGQIASGFFLILAAFVFAILYLGTRRMPTPPVNSPVDAHSP